MAIKNRGIILRHSLIRKFEEIADSQIIYICAPAGFGKTVAALQWLDQGGHERAFVSLDEFDNESAHFCRRFCAALCNCQPKNVTLSKIAAHPSFDNAPDEFTFRTLEALTGGKQIRLVIDDLHFINDERVLRLLLSLLKRLPENFQIILISRNELPPGFSDLWLKGSLACVAADNLRFTHDEIILLYKERGCSITSKKANEILNFTDGWAIGIRAVLLSGGDTEGENIEYLEEFIKTHVWPRWDKETREFLLKTSVVQELTPSLCEALTDIPNSEKLLNKLIKQNAFISRTESGAYRYHSLFHIYLLHTLEELGVEYIQNLHSKAGYWYLGERDFYSAIDCFIKCGNKDGIIQCFTFLALAGRKSFVVEKLLPIINQSMLSVIETEFPHIYAAFAWAAFNEGRAADMARYADKYYENYHNIVQLYPRLKFFVVFMYLMDFRITLFELLQSIQNLPVNIKGNQHGGEEPLFEILNQNMPLLHRGTRDFSDCTTGDIEMNIAVMKSAIGNFFGEETELLAKSVAAGLLYEQGHLEKALSYALTANSEINRHFSPEIKFCSMAILSYIQDALEQQAQADQTIKRIADMIEQEGAYFLNYNFNALTARRKLGKGDIKTASDWLAEHETPLNNSLDFYKIYGHITTCRAYITKGDYDSAIILLKKALALAESYNRPLDSVETQILLSIAYWKKKRGFQNEGVRYLEQAVSIAYDYKYTQLFVNEGAEISGMMRRLQKRVEQRTNPTAIPVSFIKMLYFKTSECQKDGLTSGQPSIPEKYTDKQLMIMRLLYGGKSFREIAEAMGIKLPTLRSHISLIYKKLDVTSQSDAVVKIRTMGLLGNE